MKVALYWFHVVLCPDIQKISHEICSRWRHEMETFSASLAICKGNPPATGGFPSQRPVKRSFGVFFDVHMNRQLSKQSRSWWSETPRAHYDVVIKSQIVLRCFWVVISSFFTLQCRYNGRDGVSNHQRHHCLLNLLLRRRSKKTPKLRVTRLCEGNSPVTSEFPAQMASNAENVSIWWRHNDGCFRDTATITQLPQCQVSNPEWYGYNRQV